MALVVAIAAGRSWPPLAILLQALEGKEGASSAWPTSCLRANAGAAGQPVEQRLGVGAGHAHHVLPLAFALPMR
jgi:hypothetical protein